MSLATQVAGPGVVGRFVRVDRTVWFVFSPTTTIEVDSTAEQLDEERDQKSGGAFGQFGEVGDNGVSVRDTKLRMMSAEVREVVFPEVPGGDGVPVEEVGAQELHELELGVIDETGTIPVTGPTRSPGPGPKVPSSFQGRSSSDSRELKSVFRRMTWMLKTHGSLRGCRKPTEDVGAHSWQ